MLATHFVYFDSADRVYYPLGHIR